MAAERPDIHDIFNEAIARESGEKCCQYLDEVCGNDPTVRGRVEALLRAHSDAGGFLGGQSLLNAATLVIPPVTEAPGTTIGPYKLREQIGEGGMGTVYVAEQEQPIRRKVALKVVKPGMDSREVISRFEAERQVLALMDHPNIAKVLDAGTTESGRPYFVMELVRGVPITDYCVQRQVPPREQLALFIQVCQAVQHAHQKGIIHRDLKPSNVLVARHDDVPVPKVIDFGIAKATSQRLTEHTVYTRFSQMMGTPLYMSPEQAELNALDVDTRSDVYSLGVLLYELLTGATPFDKETFSKVGLDEVRRIIREDEPPRPSQRISTLSAKAQSTLATRSQVTPVDDRQRSHDLRGELDWIVMKALEKDRTRRYESASAFAADVQRYLDDEPVQACPPSALYRLKKLGRRNRTALVTTAIVVVALLVGTGVSVWQAIEANGARKLADERLTLADERLVLADERLFSEKQARLDADTHRLEAETQRRMAGTERQAAVEQRQLAEVNFRQAREAVDQMLTRVANEKLASIPGVEPVRKQLLEDALMFYEQFLKHRGDDPELRFEAARAWQRVGLIRSQLGHFPDAAAAFEAANRLVDRLLQESPDDARYLEMRCTNCRGLGSAFNLGGVPESEESLNRGLQACERLQKLFPENLEYRLISGKVITILANGLWRGNPEIAGMVRRQVDAFRELLTAAPDNAAIRVTLILSLKSVAYHVRGSDFDEADRFLAEAQELCETWPDGESDEAPAGDAKPQLLSAVLFDRAESRYLARKPFSAKDEAGLRRAIALKEAFVAAHPDLLRHRSGCALAQVLLGQVLAAAGRRDEAEAAYRDACRWMLARYAPDLAVNFADAIRGLERLLARRGRADDEEFVAMRAKYHEAVLSVGPDGLNLASAAQFANHLLDSQKYAEALPFLDRAITLDGGSGSYGLRKRRGLAYFKLSRYADALVELATAIDKNPEDFSNLRWIAPADVAACPDESFRIGMLAMADRVVEKYPRRPAPLIARANLAASLGNWTVARADLEAALPQARQNLGYLRYQHALVCLALHDLPAYRADCERLLQQYPDGRNSEELHFAIWTSVLAPGSEVDWKTAIPLADRAVEVSKGSPSTLQVRGAALCRAGRLEEALQVLDKSDVGPPDPLTSPVYGWFFLAMTHSQLGHRVEARAWLSKALAETARSLSDTDSTDPIPWHRRLTLELLRSEAKKMVGGE